MKVTIYIGRTRKMEDIRKWDDIDPDEQAMIGEKLQRQCAASLGCNQVVIEKMKVG